MPDRFANGDPANDRGDYVVRPGVDPGSAAEIARHGFDPTDERHFHGGDLAGLTGALDYIKGLGATAVWTTPIMRNVPAQGGIGNYHGYSVQDFLDVDPHFGTRAELDAYVAAAHARGMRVFLDIVLNDTAHLKGYRECGGEACGRYVSKAERPYRDASGVPFDDQAHACDFAQHRPFPSLDLASFPYTPVVPADPAFRKQPDWLNDPLLYHNRGSVDFADPESMISGDLFGLDDLFTLHPRVIAGMIDIYRQWIEQHGVDGFRIDAARHVEPEMWQQWWPAIRSAASAQGKDGFFAFGEANDPDPAHTSAFAVASTLPAVLDIPFMTAAREVVASGAPTTRLAALFDADDGYTRPDTDARFLPTLLSTHDAGRIGAYVVRDDRGAGEGTRLARVELAYALLFTARGIPVVYYGDEQGFTGDEVYEGAMSEAARQDMFPTRVAAYADPALNPRLGAAGSGAGAGVGAGSHLDPSHPLYQHIRALAALRAAHVALRRGVQLPRYASPEVGGGLFAFSRVDRDERVEHLVILNTDAAAGHCARIHTLHPATSFAVIFGAGGPGLKSDAGGDLEVCASPLEARVLRATAPIPSPAATPEVVIDTPASGVAAGRFWIGAHLGAEALARVRFYARLAGEASWRFLGEDGAAPYRVPFDGSALAPGTRIEVAAEVDDLAGGRRRSPARTLVIDDRLGHVTLHYANGNGRTSFFGFRSDGVYLMPAPVPASGPFAAFDWPPGVEWIAFYFETPGDARAPFAFDQPVVVRREDMVAHAQRGSAGLAAELFIGDALAVTGADAGRSPGRPPALACDVGPGGVPPVADPPLLIKGDMNGWSNHLDPADPDFNVLQHRAGTCEFSGVLRLPRAPGSGASGATVHAFKFADLDWKAESNIGGPFSPDHGLDAAPDSINLKLFGGSGMGPTAYRVHFFSFPPIAARAGRHLFYRLEPR